ncbi:MAG: hypothetical protein FH758_10850 [Firmicutes bacterium]|nr:hypothetical protein [Bacillota bacterium]
MNGIVGYSKCRREPEKVGTGYSTVVEHPPGGARSKTTTIIVGRAGDTDVNGAQVIRCITMPVHKGGTAE